jgi:hypothetical protein
LTATGAASYLWSTGETTPSITVTAAGTYTVIGSNGSGCADTASVNVTVNPKPRVYIEADLSICQGDSAVLFAGGAVTYLWSTGDTTQEITVHAAGTYTVIGFNAAGCADTASETITVNPKPQVSINGPLSLCAGSSSTLTATGAISYIWNTGATTASITVTAAGTYTVIGTNASGCTDTAIVNVILNTKPTVAITGPLTFCPGGSTTLTATGAASYVWSNGAHTASITISTPGQYTVTGTAVNGCTATASATVTTSNSPVTVTITPSGPLSFCEGGSVTLTASGAVTYLWNTGATTPSITVTTTGTYTVTGTNASGCTGTATINVTVNPKPDVNITGNLTTCHSLFFSDPAVLTASGATTYLWDNGATTATINVFTARIWTVVGTNAFGCKDTASVRVVDGQKPIISIAANGPLKFCQGDSVKLSVDGLGAVRYLWSTGDTTISIIVKTAGPYSVIATSSSGCTRPASLNVVVYPKPTVAITGTLSFCPGSSTTLTASGAVSYRWNTGATTATLTVTAAGTYTVTGTDANGCTNTASVTVTADACLQVQACSYSQSFYGNPAGRACNGLSATNAVAVALSKGPLVVGSGNKKITIQPNETVAILDKLPATGLVSSLPEGTVTVTDAAGSGYLRNGKFNNELVGQTIALSLNTRNSPELAAIRLSGTMFSTSESSGCVNGVATGSAKSYRIPQNVLNCLGSNNKVEDLLALANAALGGSVNNCGATLAEINEAVTAINEGFDQCRVLTGFSSPSAAATYINGFVTNAYPNPFSSKTTIEFTNLVSDGHVQLDVYSITGQKIGTIFDDDIVKGTTYKAELSAATLSEGVYMYTIKSGNDYISRKLVVDNK